MYYCIAGLTSETHNTYLKQYCNSLISMIRRKVQLSKMIKSHLTFGRFFVEGKYFHSSLSSSYMQKTCDVAEKAILAKKKLRKKCVNRDKM